MHILLTNDDSIGSPGLRLVADLLTTLGHRVHVVAPQRDWSGQSQSISMSGVLHADPARGWTTASAWAVDGSPADCVRVAVALLGLTPDLVVAGMNLGSNLGSSIYRSATVGATREAALAGWPALALSGPLPLPAPESVRRHLPSLLALALDQRGALVNVNWPDGPGPHRVMVPPAWDTLIERPVARPADDRGTVTITMERAMRRPSPDDATDVGALAAGLVAVSVLPVLPAPATAGRTPMCVGGSIAAPRNREREATHGTT
ncbi:MAG: 5'/3'-nucleotidase SurE [Thermaerobacter sp.]|nr:5'/3'-nucleotidase SurE [Thermaerobacter sp.]